MIIVMGLPGVGKTAVLDSFLKENLDFKIINYGTLMFEVAKNNFNIEKRDGIRLLSLEIQKQIQELVSEKIKELSEENEKLILDTHCAIKTKGGYLPGLPLKNLKSWNVSHLILITAPVLEIYSRSKKDKTRTRDDQTLDELKEYQDVNNHFLAVYSASIGVPCGIIKNNEGKLDQASKNLRKMIFSVTKKDEKYTCFLSKINKKPEGDREGDKKQKDKKI